MGARDDLAQWLKTRTPDQLRRIRDRYGMHHFSMGHLPQVAYLIMQDYAVQGAMSECNLAEIQALNAVVWLAEQHHGAFPRQPYQNTDDPALRAVPRGEVLRHLAGDDVETRAKAENVLDGLAEVALILPSRKDKVVVGGGVHRSLAGAVGIGRKAERLMADYYNAPEVHAIAEALGFKKEYRRVQAQANVLSVLTDPVRLRALIDEAPAEVVHMLQQVGRHNGLLATHAIRPDGGPNQRFTINPSGDARTDWLVARGLLLPAGVPERVEMPIEVMAAIGRSVQLAFHPDPPDGASDAPPADDGQAQAAASAAAGQIERLLAACAAQPLAVRQTGGVAVRDTKRLAKGIGLDVDLARFWIDLCYMADLLGGEETLVEHRRGGSQMMLMPTTGYDRWLTRSPAGRLVPVIVAWAVVPQVYTWWPNPDEPRVALVSASDPSAVPLRYALLEALAVRPGADIHGLLEVATWHRPLHIPDDDPAPAVATIREAELLGLVAAGRLTTVGRAVLALLRAVGVDSYPDLPAAPDVEKALTTLMPPPQTQARFQADLTAVVAGAPTAVLADLLSSVADRESEGHAVVWRFSPGSVRRALDSGRDAATLIEELSEVAHGSLPQPLEYMIKDAARTHGRMRVVRSACCIRSDDEALVAEMSKAKGLSTLKLRRIAPTVLVSVRPAKETLEVLRAAGYTPVLEAATGDTVVEKAPQRRAQARHTL